MLFERLHLLLEDLGLLEVHTLRGLLHESLIMLYDLAASSPEQLHDLLDVLVIFLLRNTSYTAASALLYMEIQARAELAAKDCVGGYLVAARP